MINQAVEKIISNKLEQITPFLNEKSIRLWAAVEALSLGYGGITKVSRSTGLSRTTIHVGIAELNQSETETFSVKSYGSVRRLGGGRKSLTEKDPTLLEDLESLVEPGTRGDPQSPLRWTTKSTVKLAKELQYMGHQVSQRSVVRLLGEARL